MHLSIHRREYDLHVNIYQHIKVLVRKEVRIGIYSWVCATKGKNVCILLYIKIQRRLERTHLHELICVYICIQICSYTESKYVHTSKHIKHVHTSTSNMFLHRNTRHRNRTHDSLACASMYIYVHMNVYISQTHTLSNTLSQIHSLSLKYRHTLSQIHSVSPFLSLILTRCICISLSLSLSLLLAIHLLLAISLAIYIIHSLSLSHTHTCTNTHKQRQHARLMYLSFLDFSTVSSMNATTPPTAELNVTVLSIFQLKWQWDEICKKSGTCIL